LLHLTPQTDARVLVGNDYPDDAVVIRVNETTVLVQTVDFFTPVVDDPYDYGRIAAANSLSDVYAMGGTPLTAMNIVCFPTSKLGPEVLSEILRGGGDVLREAGAILAGGHSVEDPEPKFGLAVTGLIDPARITTKGGARVGELLVLTKPVGTGILTTAHKRGQLPDDELAETVGWMTQLNDVPSRAMVACQVTGATDVTGFSLLGHAFEMCRGAGLRFVIHPDRVPVSRGAFAALEAGCLPGGSRANQRWLEKEQALTWPDTEQPWRDLLCDSQTSGGLLISLPAERLDEFGSLMLERKFWVIGRVEPGPMGISVRSSAPE
jgi:selenide,water dikinase